MMEPLDGGPWSQVFAARAQRWSANGAMHARSLSRARTVRRATQHSPALPQGAMKGCPWDKHPSRPRCRAAKRAGSGFWVIRLAIEAADGADGRRALSPRQQVSGKQTMTPQAATSRFTVACRRLGSPPACSLRRRNGYSPETTPTCRRNQTSGTLFRMTTFNLSRRERRHADLRRGTRA